MALRTNRTAAASPRARERPVVGRMRGMRLDGMLPLHRSIRIRLTAWYTLILLLILISLGVLLQSQLVRSFENDVDGRLQAATAELRASITTRVVQSGGRIVDNRLAINRTLLPTIDADSIVYSGLWFGAYTVTDDRVTDAGTLGNVESIQDELGPALRNAGLLSISEDQFGTIEIDGSSNRVYVTPLIITENEARFDGVLIVGEPLGSRDRMIDQINKLLQISGLTGIVLATWGGWLIAGRALSPVGRITKTADSIANSEGAVSLSRRLDVPDTADEISDLAVMFNAMLDRIETAFNAQRRFVGDASHELRTPLTSVRGNVDVLLRQLRSGRQPGRTDLIEALGDVQRESSRMSRLIEDLLVLARTDVAGLGSLLKPTPVSLDVLANEAFRTANALVEDKELRLDIQDTLMLNVDGDRLVQVMLILLDNALRYTPTGGLVTLRVGAARDAHTQVDCARIDVEDDGPGVPAQSLPHLFERFYRAEDSRARASGGTGLGLSIALAIVRGHRGWIDVETSPHSGTRFSIWLPLDASAGTAEQTASS